MSMLQKSRTLASFSCRAALIAAILLPAVAGAQNAPPKQYRSVPPQAWVNNKPEFNRVRLEIPTILRGGIDFRTAQPTLDMYYQQYIFPSMTLYDNSSLASLPEKRKDFLTTLQLRTPSQQVHDHVVAMTLSTMEKIAIGDFHPAVRYNAMLIIGELNSEEAQLIGNPRLPPLTLTEARPILIRELNNPNQLDAVRVAALLGIHRHARLESENAKFNRGRFNDADIRQLIDQMLTIIKADPPAGRTEEGHVWMQRRAIEVLAEIGTVDAGGSVATELERIVSSDTAPIELRCTSARAMGKLNFTTVQNFDAAAAAAELGRLAVYCCQQEIDRVAQAAKEEEDRKLRMELAKLGPGLRGGPRSTEGPRGIPERGPSPFFPGPGGELDLAQQEVDWKLLVSKRRLKYQLGSVRMALAGSQVKTTQPPRGGLTRRATGAQQTAVGELVQAIDRLMSALDASVTTQEDLLKGVAANLQPLAALVGDSSGSPAPALGPGAPAPANAPGPGQVDPTAPAPGQALPGQVGPGQLGPGQQAPGQQAPGQQAPGPGGPGQPVEPAPAPGLNFPM